MADITPLVSLNGELASAASLNGELAMPEKVWMQGPPGPKGDKGDKGDPGIDLTDEEVLASLIAANVLSAVTSDGAILTDKNNNILMM